MVCSKTIGMVGLRILDAETRAMGEGLSEGVSMM